MDEKIKRKKLTKKTKFNLALGAAVITAATVIPIEISSHNNANYSKKSNDITENSWVGVPLYKLLDNIRAEQIRLNSNILSMGATVSLDDLGSNGTLTSGLVAKYGLKNADGTPFAFRWDDFHYRYELSGTNIRVIASIYMCMGGRCHYEETNIGPHWIRISRNSFTGTFSSLAKEKEFLAITDRVEDKKFLINSDWSITNLKSISLPDVTYIGKDAFGEANNITSLDVPKLKHLDQWAFGHSGSLTRINAPNLEYLGYGAFQQARVAQLSLPKLVTWVGNCPFQNNTFTSLNLPNILTMGKVKIKNESSTNVTLPFVYNTPTELSRIFGIGATGNDAINDMRNWDKVNFTWTDPLRPEQVIMNSLYSMGITATDQELVQTTPAIFDDATIAKYGLRSPGTITQNNMIIIDDLYKGLKDGFVYKYTATSTNIKIQVFAPNGAHPLLDPIEIPLSRNLFDGQLGKDAMPTFLAIGDSVGDDFSNYLCKYITSMTLPNVKTLGNHAFLQAYNLEEVNMPEVTHINTYGFGHAHKLTSLSAPKLRTIDTGGFEQTPALKVLDLPELRTLNRGSFEMSTFTSVNLPKASTIGKLNVVNDASTNVTISAVFNNDAEKDRIFGAGNWDKVTFNWSWDVNAEQYRVNQLLSMGATAGFEDFEQATETVLDDAAVEKYGIKNADGTPYTFKDEFVYKYTATDENILVTVYTKDGEKAIDSNGAVEFGISRNSFTGTFANLAEEKAFLAIRDKIEPGSFRSNGVSSVTSMYLPDVTEMSDKAFIEASSLETLIAPKLVKLGTWTFAHAFKLHDIKASRLNAMGYGSFQAAASLEINFPDLEVWKGASFDHHPVTLINLPKVNNIEGKFVVENAVTTSITLKSIFNTPEEKDRIFGAGNWDKITFHWLEGDTDPSEVTPESLAELLEPYLEIVPMDFTSFTDLDVIHKVLNTKVAELKAIIDGGEIFDEQVKQELLDLSDQFMVIYKRTLIARVQSFIDKIDPIYNENISPDATALRFAYVAFAQNVKIWKTTFSKATIFTVPTIDIFELSSIFGTSETTIDSIITNLKAIAAAKAAQELADQEKAAREEQIRLITEKNWEELTKAKDGDSDVTKAARKQLEDTLAELKAMVKIVKTTDGKTTDDKMTETQEAADEVIFASIDDEQDRVNQLISIGISDLVEAPTSGLLDALAIEKYGIKNADGTSFLIDPEFTYSYLVEDGKITIIVLHYLDKLSSGHAPVAITIPSPILENNIDGTDFKIKENISGDDFEIKENVSGELTIAPKSTLPDLPQDYYYTYEVYHLENGENTLKYSESKTPPTSLDNGDTVVVKVHSTTNPDSISNPLNIEINNLMTNSIIEKTLPLTKMQKVLIGAGSGAAVVLTLGLSLFIKSLKSRKKRIS